MALMSTTTEPDSTSITGENIAPSQQIVRLQGGGLRFLDAHEIASLNFRVVTRPQQNNDTQRWRLFDFGGGFFTIQQVSSGRFLEATLDGDFQVVTRPASGSNEQTWRLGDP
jgi:Ricin-type beta-trefoil lectin domain-like